MFDEVFKDCVLNETPLPEELQDIFSLEIIERDGEHIGIIDWVED